MSVLRVIDIVEGTSVDGPGLRTSIYFAGCKHQCPGCHNKQTWDFDRGRDMTIDELMKVIDYNDFNVTFSGGDPLYQADKIVELARRIKASGKTIWCYTGFTYEEVRDKAPYKDLLAYVDVLVDGPFIEAQRNIELRFRGSENQRIIDLNNTQTEITILR
jgi:anaerobic ribonucleoside-triphosphate reductase activating protein